MTPPVKSVALNAMFLAPGDSGGPETYLRELVRALAAEYPALRIDGAHDRRGRARARARTALASSPAYGRCRPRSTAASGASSPSSCSCRCTRAGRGAELLHSLASTGPIRTPGAPLGGDAPRRDVHAHADLRPRDDLGHDAGREARGARRRRADRGVGGRARRRSAPRSASTRPLHGRAARHGRGAARRRPRRRRRCASGSGSPRTAASCCAWPRCARTRTRSS